MAISKKLAEAGGGAQDASVLAPLIKTASPASTDGDVALFLQNSRRPYTAKNIDPAVMKAFGADTAARSKRGNVKQAIVDNMQNIVDATRSQFVYVPPQKRAWDKTAPPPLPPTPAETEAAYKESMLKAFEASRYSYLPEMDNPHLGAGTGVDVTKINPVFKRPEIDVMFNSFPDRFQAADGQWISVPHMLSGIQWNNTSADSADLAMSKQTWGVMTNAQLSEHTLKPLVEQERGAGGILAARSPALQGAFKQDPVAAMASFVDDPLRYVNEGRSTVSMHPVDMLQRGADVVTQGVVNGFTRRKSDQELAEELKRSRGATLGVRG